MNAMKITIHTPSSGIREFQVGTAHHPYLGPIPEVGQTMVIPAQASANAEAEGEATITQIRWHYNSVSCAVWPEVVCVSSSSPE
ncbi:hypothetical protein GCM10023165_45800 [Variovorax defluvii]|uniref:Uncharacterized protein n=1 Tax=Variovorax defluvii TaxID=913761 RepID=A0ABP8IA28_9BURK